MSAAESGAEAVLREGTTMESRIAYGTVAPSAMKAMGTLGVYVRHSGLEPSLLELVRLRASQINGCAYCIDMHTKDARARGEMLGGKCTLHLGRSAGNSPIGGWTSGAPELLAVQTAVVPYTGCATARPTS